MINNIWEFIEENHPNYSSSDEVLHSDIYQRFIDGEEVYPEDLEMIKEDCPEGIELEVWAVYQAHLINTKIIKDSLLVKLSESGLTL